MKTSFAIAVVLAAATTFASFVKKHGPAGEIVHVDVDGLSMTVTWNNNFTAVAELTDEDKDYKEACIFPGKFIKDEKSSVLVTGCADEELAVQFHSGIFGDYIMTITKEGKVKDVDPGEEFKELVFQSEDFTPFVAEDNKRIKREDKEYDEYDYSDFTFESVDLEDLPDLGDYEIDDELLPEKVEVQLNVYIDPAFRQLHGYKTKNMLRRIIGQADLLMKHPTLNTKVQFVHNNRFYDSKQHLRFKDKATASKDFKTRLPKLLKSPLYVDGHPVNHVYFTVPDSRFIKGVASGGSICNKPDSKDGRPRAIIAWNKDVSRTAVTMAHEVGHTLGMFHDFERRRWPTQHRTKKQCSIGTKTGHFILSYGNNPQRTVWSECSNEDFKDYYFKVMLSEGSDDKFCLKEEGGADVSACSADEFQCGGGGRCIPANQRCDGLKRHCHGGEDELNCNFFD